VEGSGGWWKGHPRVTSEEVECSGFCGAVEGAEGGGKSIPVSRLKKWDAVDSVLGGREWRTVERASRVTSEEAECSGFYTAVEGGGKSIPVSRLKRWSIVDSTVRWRAVGSDGKCTIPSRLKMWNMVDSAVRWMLVESSGERWKARYPLASEDVEYGGFCGAVDAGGE
jgi:hypothetical protein